MSRSLKKGPFVDGHLQKKIETAQATRDKKPIKTWSRRSTILPEFIDKMQIKNLKVGTASVDLLLRRHDLDVGITVIRRAGKVEVVSVK